MTADIVIVAAARTAVGKFCGTLAKTSAPELGAAVVVVSAGTPCGRPPLMTVWRAGF